MERTGKPRDISVDLALVRPMKSRRVICTGSENSAVHSQTTRARGVCSSNPVGNARDSTMSTRTTKRIKRLAVASSVIRTVTKLTQRGRARGIYNDLFRNVRLHWRDWQIQGNQWAQHVSRPHSGELVGRHNIGL